jgi:hypothetical protein
MCRPSWASWACGAGQQPAELQALLGSEIKRWGEVIRAAKIEPE